MDLTRPRPRVPLPRMAEVASDHTPEFAEERAPLTKGEVYTALVQSKGNIAAAARALDARRSKIVDIISSTPEIKAMLEDFRESIVDKAEDNIFSDVERGDQSASRFVAQTIGKDRGWSQGVSGTGKDGAIVVEIRKFAEEPATNG